MSLSRRALMAGMMATALPRDWTAGALIPPPPEDDSALLRELLRRTEANAERNAAAVKRATQENAYTAYSGEDMKKLVRAEDGSDIMLTDAQMGALTREGRLACAMGEPCRIVARDEALALGLPKLKKLECDADGRNCKFRDQ